MVVENSVTQIISASRSNPELLAQLEKFRRDVTVMFTDIKGSTRYFEKYGDVAGMMMVRDCNDRLIESVEQNRGRFIKEIGDAVMAIFELPGEGVRSAIDMQKRLIEMNALKPAEHRVAVRIGLHYGTVIVRTNDVFGDAANVASRVESVAQPEQIVISDAVQEKIAGSNEFKLQHLGRFALKGKEENRDLYEVVWHDKAARPASTTVHLVVSGAKASRVTMAFRLQQIKQDGTIGVEKDVNSGSLTVGSTQGELAFPGDPKLAPLHARFSAQGEQVVVEDLSEGHGVFVRLVSVYTLLDGDQVIMGSQVLTFREKPQALAAAAATGTQLTDMAAMLNEPVAEMVGTDATGEQHYPLSAESVTWGRGKGTYTFPEDRFMSGAHCRIYQRGENFFLEDAGSRNGTFVRVRGKAVVPNGASVRVGGQILRVQV